MNYSLPLLFGYCFGLHELFFIICPEADESPSLLRCPWGERNIYVTINLLGESRR